MSFIRIVGPQVAVQADGILCLVCAIRINLDAETCLVPTEFLRQSLQLTNRSNICSIGTVGYIGNTTANSRSCGISGSVFRGDSTTYGNIGRSFFICIDGFLFQRFFCFIIH